MRQNTGESQRAARRPRGLPLPIQLVSSLASTGDALTEIGGSCQAEGTNARTAMAPQDAPTRHTPAGFRERSGVAYLTTTASSSPRGFPRGAGEVGREFARDQATHC